MRLRLFLALAVLTLTACGANPSAVATAVAATVAAMPTHTPIVAIVEITVAPPEQPPAVIPAQAALTPTPPALTTPTFTTTPTSAPTPTIAATPTAPAGADLRAGLGVPNFHDEFNSGATWGIFDNENGSATVAEGVLQLIVKPRNRIQWTLTGMQGADFYAEVTASIGQCGPGDQYGLISRVQQFTDGDAYFFTLSCEGRFHLLKYRFGEFIVLIDWTSNPAINPGPQAVNLLGVWAAGERLTLYANDQLLAQFDDPEFVAGRFGLVGGSAVTPNFMTTFDDLRIWILP